jgi:hypothetical protein
MSGQIGGMIPPETRALFRVTQGMFGSGCNAGVKEENDGG